MTHNAWTILVSIFTLSIIVEYLVQQLKSLCPDSLVKKMGDNQKTLVQLLALVVGILVAFIAQADVFTALSIPTVNKTVDYLLTGILISGGSSFLHAMFDNINKVKNLQPPTDKPE